jgi:hypothetical protein
MMMSDRIKEDFFCFYKNEVNSDKIDILLNVSISKKVFKFIIKYCNIINIAPSDFFNSLFMYSLLQLIYNVDDSEDIKAFQDIGVM